MIGVRWPNHTSPLNPDLEVREWEGQRYETWGQRFKHEKFSTSGLKMEGATWQGMTSASRSWGQPLTDSQQERIWQWIVFLRGTQKECILVDTCISTYDSRSRIARCARWATPGNTVFGLLTRGTRNEQMDRVCSSSGGSNLLCLKRFVFDESKRL